MLENGDPFGVWNKRPLENQLLPSGKAFQRKPLHLYFQVIFVDKYFTTHVCLFVFIAVLKYQFVCIYLWCTIVKSVMVFKLWNKLSADADNSDVNVIFKSLERGKGLRHWKEKKTVAKQTCHGRTFHKGGATAENTLVVMVVLQNPWEGNWKMFTLLVQPIYCWVFLFASIFPSIIVLSSHVSKCESLTLVIFVLRQSPGLICLFRVPWFLQTRIQYHFSDESFFFSWQLSLLSRFGIHTY